MASIASRVFIASIIQGRVNWRRKKHYDGYFNELENRMKKKNMTMKTTKKT
jgi:hypothetical protein